MSEIGNWWDTTKLEDMTPTQWEAICDGCGRCCLIKAWHGSEVKMCKVACKLLDCHTARCQDYTNRRSIVDNCIKITLENIDQPGLLPASCAYKRLRGGQGLDWWHPLVSGNRQTVIDAGISVVGWVEVNEDQISIMRLADYMHETLDDRGT